MEEEINAAKRIFDAFSEQRRLLTKYAFIPPGAPQGPMLAGGAPMGPPPPGDPSMMGGGMPMDPSMMGGAPPPGDPSMMGGAPPMDPSMAGGMAPPPPGDPSMMGGGMPMDPSMGGAPPPPGDPSMMGGAPPAGGVPPQLESTLSELASGMDGIAQAVEQTQAVTDQLASQQLNLSQEIDKLKQSLNGPAPYPGSTKKPSDVSEGGSGLQALAAGGPPPEAGGMPNPGMASGMV